MTVQVLPLKMVTEVYNFHRWYTSTARARMWGKFRKSHCRIFKDFNYKFLHKISIWSPTNKHSLHVPMREIIDLCHYFKWETCTIGGWLNTFLPRCKWNRSDTQSAWMKCVKIWIFQSFLENMKPRVCWNENTAYSEPNSCRFLQTSKGRWCQLTIGCLHVLIKRLRSRDDKAKHI